MDPQDQPVPSPAEIADATGASRAEADRLRRERAAVDEARRILLAALEAALAAAIRANPGLIASAANGSESAAFVGQVLARRASRGPIEGFPP